MTLDEANRLLDSAPSSTELRAALNPVFTQAEAVEVIRKAINSGERGVRRDGHLVPLMERRVWQVVRNRRHL